MTFPGARGMNMTNDTEQTWREALAAEEQVRKEVAAMLHRNVQTRLSACNVWLSMAEKILVNLEEPTPDPELESVEGRIIQALALLHKVRGEVEQLRKADVQYAVQRLYPTLIGVGLRPALEGLQKTLGLDEGVPSTINWEFGDGFLRWDRPSGDEHVLFVRQEAYRLTEVILRTAQGAWRGSGDGPATGGERSGVPLHLDIRLDVADGVLHMSLRARGNRHWVEREILQFIIRALPRHRIVEAGGTLVVGSDDGDGLDVLATLPVTAQAAG